MLVVAYGIEYQQKFLLFFGKWQIIVFNFSVFWLYPISKKRVEGRATDRQKKKQEINFMVLGYLVLLQSVNGRETTIPSGDNCFLWRNFFFQL